MTPSRTQRHALIGAASLAAVAMFYVSFSAESPEFRVSLATAYASLVLLAITFGLGPIYYLTTRRSPASSYLRRDISIWGGALALVHVIYGLQVHLKDRMWAYFVFENWRDRFIPLRYDAFGAANYTGALATLIVLVLLAISNDLSIHKLGLERWRSIQGWGRVFAALTLFHALVYQVLEKRIALLAFPMWTIVAVVVALYAWRAFAKMRAARG